MDSPLISKFMKEESNYSEIRELRGPVNERKLIKCIDDLIEVQCNKIILLVDADCKKEEKENNINVIIGKLTESVRNKLAYTFAINAIEAWILAYLLSENNKSGLRVSGITNPEEDVIQKRS